MEALTQITYKEGMTLEEVVKEVNKRIEVMRKRSLRFEDRFDAIDRKLDGVNNRLNTIDNRLNAIETTLSNDLSAIKQTMITNENRFDILFKHLGIEDDIKDSSNTTNN